ncbi:hypothetical protein NQZ79_g1923 [Umbelopsis isabellina]|nr:hypothetical protein NQZ79_g1923 [Umbelopsis isabellina]
MMLMCAFVVRRRQSLKKKESSCFIDPSFECSDQWKTPQSINRFPTPPMPPPAAIYGQPAYYHSPSSLNQFPGESTEELNKPYEYENPPSYEYRS